MDLRELYQEIIIDHNKNPRNFRAIVHPTAEAKGYNPLCGDKLTVYVNIDQNIVQDVSFLGCGCAISQASASLMTDVMQGKTLAEAHQLFEQFHRMVTSENWADTTSSPSTSRGLTAGSRNLAQSLDVDSREGEKLPFGANKLAVLAGVREFPARVKCATLAWHTLEAALKQNHTTVSTE